MATSGTNTPNADTQRLRLAIAGGDQLGTKAAIKSTLAFPMWVVPIRTMIEVTRKSSAGDQRLPSHEVLHAEGKLVEWEPGMKTIFFSHTWLGSSHPDPKGEKSRLVYELLDGILKGTARVQAYWMALIIFGEKGIKASKLRSDFSDAYICKPHRARTLD